MRRAHYRERTATGGRGRQGEETDMECWRKDDNDFGKPHNICDQIEERLTCMEY